jgi:hypothetical protein
MMAIKEITYHLERITRTTAITAVVLVYDGHCYVAGITYVPLTGGCP